VELPVARALRFAGWPAVWPAAVVGLGLTAVEAVAPDTLLMIAAEAALAAALYYALFAIAIGDRDRREYRARILELLGRRLAPAT
jgi:hypothetical protein